MDCNLQTEECQVEDNESTMEIVGEITQEKSSQCLLKPPTENKYVMMRPKSLSKAIQVETQKKEVGCQCNILTPGNQFVQEDPIGRDSEQEMSEDSDVEWTPEMQSDSEESDNETSLEMDNELEEVDEELRSNLPADEERKFIIFESCLLALLSVCLICTGPCKVLLKYVKGSFIVVQQICDKGHSRTWSSQPLHGTLPQGNLQLAAGILFSGSSPIKVINMLKHINILTIAYRTFNFIQSHYLIPAVFHVWNSEQQLIFENLRISGEKVILGGDGRCDSPGHSAKYGSYSVIDLEHSKVLDMQLIQSNEVTSSNAMELEGLKRCLNMLDNSNIEIESLTSDRHRGVQKYMREQRPLIRHFYDVWHMAKSIYRKLLALAKKAGCGPIKEWAHSISNHLYWCAASSQGDGELVRQKWQSISNHVANIHHGHSERYPKCLHGTINDSAWLVSGSRAHKGLQLLVNNKIFLKDIAKLSPSGQTSSLEAYHSVLLFFAPKMVHFFFPAMKARLLLACLHYNENSDRAQARSKSGKLLWSVSYPKYKEGATVKEVKVSVTFEYVQKLNKVLQQLRKSYPTYKSAKVLKELCIIGNPPSLASEVEKQSKESLVVNHITRFPNKLK